MKYAVVDVGSNTVRLCVYDVSEDARKFKAITNRKTMASLAGYVQDGVISSEGVKAAVTAVRKCLKRAAYLDPVRVDVFATAVLRNAKNGAEAIAAIEGQTGCKVVLLSEADEAHLGFVGASSKDALEHGMLVDIGGGSTEATLIVGGRDVLRASLPMGSLSSYKAHVSDILPTEEEMAAMREAFRAFLNTESNGLLEHRVNRLFGVGGSIRALAAVNALLRPQATSRDISREDAMLLVADLLENRRAFIDAVLCVAPERLHTICCGLAILVEVFADFDAQTLHICENGVREGYLLERML